ncbi:MAG: proline--tRNA ligase, partial [Acidobacteria bacterium]|nr:proline--tRNA ligase [Acidobacteriota bacterium]
MRWSKYFIPTLREVPADAEVVSHRLILRAGLVRQLSTGLYSYLPLAQRSVIKITNIIREEMSAVDAQEFFLPALNPAELWQESGRWSLMGANMFRLKDRKGADLCLGMTHEEVITDIARRELRSYKQLPQVWYQIQTKFRDEARPKSGLLRVRQFTMKDAYSFDLDQAGLDQSFEDQRRAYGRIFSRCGLDFVIVEADSGAMGGSASNEFMVYTEAGEDLVVSCPQCHYAANLEKATSRIEQVDDGSEVTTIEKFPTPGVRTIDDLVSFAGGATADRQIKTLVFVA